MKLVETVLQKLLVAQSYVKYSKFHQPKLDYLGYWDSHEGVEIEPEKVQAHLKAVSWPSRTFIDNSFPLYSDCSAINQLVKN